MLPFFREGMADTNTWLDDPDAPRPDPALRLIVEDGLELIAPIQGDAEELFISVDENREYLREWLPWLDDVRSVDDELVMIRNQSEKEDGSRVYLIRLQEKLVGVISLNWVDWDNRSFGLGYWISKNSAGNGIVSKSCSRLIDHCFNDLWLHRAVVESAVENHSSRAVADRLGMRIEGISKDREWLYDHYVDSVMYAITAPEWKSEDQG